jgi:hypothetical protein
VSGSSAVSVSGSSVVSDSSAVSVLDSVSVSVVSAVVSLAVSEPRSRSTVTLVSVCSRPFDVDVLDRPKRFLTNLTMKLAAMCVTVARSIT